MDITSLYTVIPNGRGQRSSGPQTFKEPNSETLVRLAELVLTLNCFSFRVNFFKQTNGVAMGTKMGPSYANIFVGFVEHQFFSQYNVPKPELYSCYIDDCISATSSNRGELTQSITAVSSFHPTLTYCNLLINSHTTTNVTERTFNHIPFTHTFHPHNHSVKSIVLKNCKLFQNDPEIGTIFLQPPLILFKHEINIGNFFVRTSFQTNDQPGIFKCTRVQCETCPFIHNAKKCWDPSNPLRSLITSCAPPPTSPIA